MMIRIYGYERIAMNNIVYKSVLGFIGGYQVFKRWELVAQKKPKPRKPVLYDFSIKDFEKKYK